MAEEGTLCINADVIKSAGNLASTTYTAEAYTNVYIKMAEGEICVQSRYDWVANYSSISTIGKEFLRSTAAKLAAFYIIEQNLSSYSQLMEAQTIMDGLWNNVVENINLLRDQDYKAWIGGE